MATETRTILVAGPDLDLLDIVSHRLRMLGFRVRLAHSLYEALACIERQPIEMAVVDLELPAIGGRSLIARLVDPPYAVRVLVLVDPHDATSYERAVEEGAFRCLPRSLCHRELDHLVEESLDTHPAPAADATRNATPDWRTARTVT